MRPRYPLLMILSLAVFDATGAEPESTVEQPQAAVVAAPEQGLKLPEFPLRESFDGILQRPLFSSNRRPEPGDDGSKATSAQELRETWRLTGIFMVGEENKALLRERNGERHLLLTKGMPLDDTWLLDEILAESVVMDSGDEKVRLELLEPRDTEPVEPIKPAQPTEPAEPAPTPAADGQNSDSEVRNLDERAREAASRLKQEIQTTKEQRNE